MSIQSIIFTDQIVIYSCYDERTWHFCTFPNPIPPGCNYFSPPILPKRDDYRQWWSQSPRRLVRIQLALIELIGMLTMSATPNGLANVPNYCRSTIRFRCSFAHIFGLNAQMNCTIADDVPEASCDTMVAVDSCHTTADIGCDCDRMECRDDSLNSIRDHSSIGDATDNGRQRAEDRLNGCYLDHANFGAACFAVHRHRGRVHDSNRHHCCHDSHAVACHSAAIRCSRCKMSNQGA